MGIELKTAKMLWGRAAQRCSICKQELIEDATETDDESIVGDMCHIVGRHPNGPRGESPLPEASRDKYGNLILLCKVHHKIVDDQPNAYTVAELQELKADHESWVRESLSTYDPQKQRDEETYAGYIDRWAQMSDLDHWMDWSFGIFADGQPALRICQDKALSDLGLWLLSRIWSGRYPPLEAAFDNYRQVLDDFLALFHQYAEDLRDDGEELTTRKFYKIPQWDPVRYHRLTAQYDFHTDLVCDLFLELTRAANYVCDKVREFIQPSYRVKQGALLIREGLGMDLKTTIYRIEYEETERTLHPYPGLKVFREIRTTRDAHYGSGTGPIEPDLGER